MKYLSKKDEVILGKVDPTTITEAVHRNFHAPDQQGFLPNPDGVAEVTGLCEDTVRVQLHLRSGVVVRSRFQTDGCGFTVACANAACTIIKGHRIARALTLEGAAIDHALGGLPREHRHCADLAASAVRAAAKDALATPPDARRTQSP